MILEILNKLAATSKRTEKEEILKSLTGEAEKLFKRVAVVALDSGHDFYIKQYDRGQTNCGTLPLSDAIDELMQNIATRRITGNNAHTMLTNLSWALSADDSEVFYRIIQRDLKCSVSESTLNKIWPDLIYVPPYMRCSSFNEKNLKKIKYPCISQTKEDGQYVDIFVNDDKTVQYFSRNNSEYKQFNTPVVDSKFAEHAGNVFMGEVLVIDENGDYLDRKTGNGYLNNDVIDPTRLVFVLWDVVSLESYRKRVCKSKYVHRFNTLKSMIRYMQCKQIKAVDSRVYNSAEDIIEHFKENVMLGKEGTVIKNLDAIWKDYTSPDQIKCKIEFQVDLVITAVNEGTNSNEGKLGAFTCETSDGKLKVNVGTGFKAAERDKFFTNDMIGKIATVKANDIVQDKSDLSVYSLFLPVFIEIRKDKTQADDFERVVEQKEAFVEMLKVIK